MLRGRGGAQVWKGLDHSGNGMLDRQEFSDLNRKLHVQWDVKAAWKELLAVTELVERDKQLRDKVSGAGVGRRCLCVERAAALPA